METSVYDEAVSTYQWVKENIKYAFPHWGSPKQTLQKKRGHCGIKSELLVSLLRDKGIEVRYVEGRPIGWKLIIMRLVSFDVHFWVEAKVDNQWLTLDPVADSSIAHFLGDTKPGNHLGNPEWITRWEELPPWYKDGYNMSLFSPLRLLTNIQLFLLHHIKAGGK